MGAFAVLLSTILMILMSVSGEQGEEVEHIIDALVGGGGFSGWSEVLSSAPPQDFPFSATFLVPSGADGNILNPLVLAYHIVPQRLSFSDLLLFKNHARLPTLLPGRSILITSNSSLAFALDGTRLTRPDLYLSASVAVHAVADVLDHTLYGDPHAFTMPPPAAAIYDDDDFFTGGAPAPPPPLVLVLVFITSTALFLTSLS